MLIYIVIRMYNILYHIIISLYHASIIETNAKKYYLRRMNRNPNINKVRLQINELVRISI